MVFAMRSEESAEGGLSRRVLVGLAVLAGAVAGCGLFAVIGAGFALSFDAVGAVGRASGIRSGLSWLLPAAVDGAMSVGTVTAVVVRRFHRSTAYPWTVVLVNAGISVACNALHAYMGEAMRLPVAVATSVSAIPAVNLAMSVHLLVTLVDALAHVLNPGADRAAAFSSCGSEPAVEEEMGHGHVSLSEASDFGNNDKQPLPGDYIPAADGSTRRLQRAAWRWAQVNLGPGGDLPSGECLGAAFCRSPRWGRMVKQLGTGGAFD